MFIRSNSAFCHLALFSWCLAGWLWRRLTPGLGVCNFSYVQWHVCRACFAHDARQAIAVHRSPCGAWRGDSGPPPPTEGGGPFAAQRLRSIRCDRPMARFRPASMRWLLLRCCIACPARFWMLFIHEVMISICYHPEDSVITRSMILAFENKDTYVDVCLSAERT